MDGFEGYRRHVNPALCRLEEMCRISRRFVKAEGNYLWDDEGAEYLDFLSGHGSQSFGHNHPAVARAVMDRMNSRTPVVYGFAASPYMGQAAAMMVERAGPPLERVLFTNSGTEAVEEAVKLARAATRRPRIIYCHKAYHGVTMGSLSMMEKGPWRDPFEPLMPEFHAIPFNDLAALKAELESGDCAALVVEPVQAEGGIVLPSAGYLKSAGDLCNKYGALLALDEAQTGLGRTGRIFAFQHFGVTPDILILAKALGGGLLPAGAALTSGEVFDAAYGSTATCYATWPTFGGNSLSCAAIESALSLLDGENLVDRAARMGDLLMEKLKSQFGGHPLITDIRGLGLLAGVEFGPAPHPWLEFKNMGLEEFGGSNSMALLAKRKLLEERVLTDVCGHDWSVLKLEPPLTVTGEEIGRLIAAMAKTLDWLESVS